MKDNTERQQQEAARGTLHASQGALIDGQDDPGRAHGHEGTAGGYPPSARPDHVSVWELYEVARVVQTWLWWMGPGTSSRRALRGRCRTSSKSRATAAARRGTSPGEVACLGVCARELSRWSVKLACDQFERMGKAEYLAQKTKILRQEVEELWKTTVSRPSKGTPRTAGEPETKPEAKAGVKRKGPDLWWRLGNRKQESGAAKDIRSSRPRAHQATG